MNNTHAECLWQLLDDIDTLDDSCRDNDAEFRRQAHEVAAKRFAHATSPGNWLQWKDRPKWNWKDSSAFRGEPDRPYAGQSHTFAGERGKSTVPPMTLRDLGDLVREALDDYPWHFGSGQPDLDAITQNILHKVSEEALADVKLVEA